MATLTNNLAAIIDPLAADDTVAGYSIGSRWINTITGAAWICTDNTTSAAVWGQTNFQFQRLADQNTETLAGTKTLTDASKIYQFLDPNGVDRIVDLPPTTVDNIGSEYRITNNAAFNTTNTLDVQTTAVSQDILYPGKMGCYISTGTAWIPTSIGTGSSALTRDSNVAIGKNAKGYNAGIALGENADGTTNGVAIGYGANGSTNGVAIGYGADGNTNGVAIGRNATGNNHSVAVGYETTAVPYSVALGSNSVTTRRGELAISIDEVSQNANRGTVGWKGVTYDATQTEIFLNGNASDQFTIKTNSAVLFSLQIIGINLTSNVGATYNISGVIKQILAGSPLTQTALFVGNPSKTIIGEDDIDIDVTITADDTNKALALKVTGLSGETINWVAQGTFVEVLMT